MEFNRQSHGGALWKAGEVPERRKEKVGGLTEAHGHMTLERATGCKNWAGMAWGGGQGVQAAGMFVPWQWRLLERLLDPSCWEEQQASWWNGHRGHEELPRLPSLPLPGKTRVRLPREAHPRAPARREGRPAARQVASPGWGHGSPASGLSSARAIRGLRRREASRRLCCGAGAGELDSCASGEHAGLFPAVGATRESGRQSPRSPWRRLRGQEGTRPMGGTPWAARTGRSGEEQRQWGRGRGCSCHRLDLLQTHREAPAQARWLLRATHRPRGQREARDASDGGLVGEDRRRIPTPCIRLVPVFYPDPLPLPPWRPEPGTPPSSAPCRAPSLSVQFFIGYSPQYPSPCTLPFMHGAYFRVLGGGVRFHIRLPQKLLFKNSASKRFHEISLQCFYWFAISSLCLSWGQFLEV